MIVGLLLLPRTRDRAAGSHFDIVGTVLLATATTALLLGLSGISGIRLSPWVVAALFAVAVTAIPLFLARERRFPYPLVAPGLMRIRAVAVGYVGTFTSYLLLYAPLVLVPQLFIPLGMSERVVGPMLSALPLGFVVATIAVNTLLPKANSVRLGSGAVVAGAGVVVLALQPLDATYAVVGLGLLGLGLGVFVPADNATVMAAVPRAETGMGSGLISMIRNLGTAVGVATVTLALHAAGHDSRVSVDGRADPAYAAELDAAHGALAVLAVAAVATIAVALELRRISAKT